jgi:hypothetical protein
MMAGWLAGWVCVTHTHTHTQWLAASIFTQSTRAVSKFSIAACCSAPLPIGPTPGMAQPPATGNTHVLLPHITAQLQPQYTDELA